MHINALFENSLNISHLHQISNYNSQGRVEDFHIHNALLTLCGAKMGHTVITLLSPALKTIL